MLLLPLSYWKAADSSIMTYCTRTAYWMFHDAIPSIVDTLLTLTLITSKLPLYTQLLYATNHIRIFEIQYYVCMYYRLHPGVLLTLNFWSTAIYTIWLRNDVAYYILRSFHKFLVNTVRLPNHSLSMVHSTLAHAQTNYHISQFGHWNQEIADT